MKRKDCFFGLHFDYHANEHTRDIGKQFDASVLEKIIREVKPDFIQCDTKGHPGYSSYRTKVGTPAPYLCNDLLKCWREVTKKYGVLLFSHYSGVWDRLAAREHPDWAAVTENGTATEKISVFGDYAEKLLIPQLKELALEYGMDGAWVDGECWALENDHSEKAAAAWRAYSGKELKDLSEKEKKEYLQFQRERFFAYVKKYIDEVKKAAPEFEITSNWLNTAWAPDNICITDYISGDLSATNSVDSARFDGRIMQSFGRNWDIMSWGISAPVHYVKSAVQLCQEAAVILSLGGGFQIYNMQSPQKVVMDEWAIPVWAEVAGFCRARQPYCQGARPLPDVGILYSPEAYYDRLTAPFYRDSEYNMELYGILTALCDCGRSVSVIHEQRKDVDFSAYRAIAVSDLTAMGQGTEEKLLDYARKGGNLLLFGVNTAERFGKKLGVAVRRAAGEQPLAVISGEGYATELRDLYAEISGTGLRAVAFMNECIVDGDLKCGNPPPSICITEKKMPAFAVMPYGKGKIGIMPLNAGRAYFDANTFELRRFFKICMHEFEEDALVVCDTPSVDVYAAQKDGKVYLHLINLSGEHRSGRIKTFDTIPPVYEVKVRVQMSGAPKTVTVLPEGCACEYDYRNGALTVCLAKLEIHTVIEIA